MKPPGEAKPSLKVTVVLLPDCKNRETGSVCRFKGAVRGGTGHRGGPVSLLSTDRGQTGDARADRGMDREVTKKHSGIREPFLATPVPVMDVRLFWLHGPPLDHGLEGRNTLGPPESDSSVPHLLQP